MMPDFRGWQRYKEEHPLPIEKPSPLPPSKKSMPAKSKQEKAKQESKEEAKKDKAPNKPLDKNKIILTAGLGLLLFGVYYYYSSKRGK